MTTVALPPIALALVYGLGIDPFYRHPYQIALEEARRWCTSGYDGFQAKWHYDWSKGSEAVYVLDAPWSPRLSCLFKIKYVWKPRGHVGVSGYSTTSFALSQDGRLKREFHVYNWADQGGQDSQTPAQMEEYKKLIAALPGSQSGIPMGNEISIGVLDRGGWSTRVYDNARLPPEVATLLKAIDPR
jgi:hypothetical protein